MPLPVDMRLLLSLLLLVLLAGCDHRPQPDLSLPDNWEHDQKDRWWRVGIDTTGAFPAMETLEEMGVRLDPIVYDATTPLSQQGRVGEERIIRYVKQSLIAFFRNRPDVVDSLFTLLVEPKIRKEGPAEDPAAVVARFKREGYRIIYRYFHEPRPVLQLGKDIPVVVPDSLVAMAAGQGVQFQVLVSETGDPIAIKRLDSVHPLLDRIALVATTRMRWQPAYLLRGQKSRALPAWVRFRVRFPGSGTPDS